MSDSRLRFPLNDLWEDIQVQGLPVLEVGNTQSGVVLTRLPPGKQGGRVRVATASGNVEDWYTDCYLDLSRIGASDILVRKLARVMGLDPSWARWWRYSDQGPIWAIGVAEDKPAHVWWGSRRPGADREKYTVLSGLKYPQDHIGELGDLDFEDETRLDWGELGNPKIVDLAALGILSSVFTSRKR